MKVWYLVALVTISSVANGRVASASSQAGATESSVRTFMALVAHDVTREGPLAWLRYFDDSPAFFMAVNGQLAFPDSNAAKVGTREFARRIQRIELNWGQDLRVDPLSERLAVVVGSWQEIQTDTAGHRVEEHGIFTGLVEFRNGRWRFRNAHWSSPVFTAPTR